MKVRAARAAVRWLRARRGYTRRGGGACVRQGRPRKPRQSAPRRGAREPPQPSDICLFCFVATGMVRSQRYKGNLPWACARPSCQRKLGRSEHSERQSTALEPRMRAPRAPQLPAVTAATTRRAAQPLAAAGCTQRRGAPFRLHVRAPHGAATRQAARTRTRASSRQHAGRSGRGSAAASFFVPPVRDAPLPAALHARRQHDQGACLASAPRARAASPGADAGAAPATSAQACPPRRAARRSVGAPPSSAQVRSAPRELRAAGFAARVALHCTKAAPKALHCAPALTRAAAGAAQARRARAAAPPWAGAGLRSTK
jgi:hypothetical protein